MTQNNKNISNQLGLNNDFFAIELTEKESTLVTGGYSESCNNDYCYQEYQSPGDFYQNRYGGHGHYYGHDHHLGRGGYGYRHGRGRHGYHHGHGHYPGFGYGYTCY